MPSNEILEEVWAAKAALWHEAHGDMATLGKQLREFTASHPSSAPVLRSAEDLRALVRSRAQPEPSLREEPPPYGEPKD